VDLNAPRLRYMRENALELPALTLLPIRFWSCLTAGRRAVQLPSPPRAAYSFEIV